MLLAIEQTQGRTWEGEVAVGWKHPEDADAGCVAAVCMAVTTRSRKLLAAQWVRVDGDGYPEWLLSFVTMDEEGCVHAHLAVPL